MDTITTEPLLADKTTKKIDHTNTFSPHGAPPAGLAAIKDSARPASTDPIHTIVESSGAQQSINIGKVGSGIAASEEAASIPCFDLEAMKALRPSDKKAEAERLLHELKTVGFVGIKASDLTDVLPQVHRTIKAYFHQNDEAKMQDWHDNAGQTGFSPFQAEKAASAEVPDLKETYFITPEYFTEASKKWPTSDVAHFKEVMTDYFGKLSAHGQTAMEMVFEGLGKDSSPVQEYMQAAGNKLRLAFYPAPKDSDNPQGVRAARHTDLNYLTLLPPATVPGLQLLSKEGQWIDVTVPKDYLILNTGDQLEAWTQGEVKATPHQVLRTEGDNRERCSTPFFASLPDKFVVNEETGCTVGEHRTARLIELGYITPDAELLSALQSKGLLLNYQLSS